MCVRQIVVTGAVLVMLFCSLSAGNAKEVRIPISLDYQLLTALVSQSSYTGPDTTAELINEGDGCIRLVLSKPDFSGVDGAIHFSSELYLHAGTPVGVTCLIPYEWEGSITVVQEPQLNSETWELTFKTVDTTLYSSDNTPVQSLNLIWERLVPLIDSYMQGVSIRLTPPLEDLKNLILPLFSAEAQQEANMLLQSIRPGSIDVDDAGVTVNVLAEAAEVDAQANTEVIETMTDAEVEAFLELWETWDSLLIYLVSLLAEQQLTEPEKSTLVNLVLDTRYEFVTQFDDQTTGRDFVRDQFVHGWTQLSKIFRKYYLYNPDESGLGYLSFITAADALVILDELGPAFGIEISRNGFIRLARILGGEAVELIYSQEINEALQQLFESGPSGRPDGSPQESSLVEKREAISLAHVFRRVDGYLFPSAFAKALPTFSEIKRWQVPEDNLTEYLVRVREILKSAYTSLAVKKNLPDKVHAVYHNLVPAVAWQESCFRQFVVADKKLTYLLSSNKSSVGIMQVNERVWRGIYDRQRLRWDIKYNAFAGCEIIDLYLQKYVLAKSGPGILSDEETLAQLVYAMYNGGPKQYGKYLERKAARNFYKSDDLFRQKYSWVKARSWNNIDKCL